MDGLDFEELSSWITQSLLISDVQVAFANFFPSLVLIDNKVVVTVDSVAREVKISCVLKLREETATSEPRELTSIIYKEGN